MVEVLEFVEWGKVEGDLAFPLALFEEEMAVYPLEVH